MTEPDEQAFAPDDRPEFLAGWWVIIVAYNRYDLVKEAAMAFLGQDMPPERVLVVDNSDVMDDDALSGLNVQQLDGHDAEGRNSGSAGGFACGMEYAFEHSASYVVLSDQDFVPYPDLLASLWRAAELHPSAAISSFTIDPQSNQVMPALLAAAPGQQPNQLCLAPNGHEMVRSLGWIITQTRFGSIDEVRAYATAVGADIGRVPLACPQGLAISREIYHAVGPFRRDFFVGWEDYEFCCRLQDRGFLLLLALGAAGQHHLAWHRTIRLGPLQVKPYAKDARLFYFHIRNSIVMARSRATGPLFARWVMRLGYHCAVYLALGPAPMRKRATAITHAWHHGLTDRSKM